jgi:isocitrate dehydrogenase
VPRLVPGWTQPIVIGRHAFGDQYRATDFNFVPGAGTLTITFTPKDGGEPSSHEVFDFPGAGVAMGMYNLDDSIRGFARACFNYALNRGWPVYLSTKNTILKVYDGASRTSSRRSSTPSSSRASRRRASVYEHRLIDDMVASATSSGTAASCGRARTTTATCSPTSSRRATARSA